MPKKKQEPEPRAVPIAELWESGILLEANRQFFNPLGLALTVGKDKKTGELFLYGIFDFLDTGGVKLDLQPDDIRKHEKYEEYAAERQSKHRDIRGYFVEPIPEK